MAEVKIIAEPNESMEAIEEELLKALIYARKNPDKLLQQIHDDLSLDFQKLFQDMKNEILHEVQKSDIEYNLEKLEKARSALPLGARRMWRGKLYEKTATGWAPVSKKELFGTEAQAKPESGHKRQGASEDQAASGAKVAEPKTSESNWVDRQMANTSGHLQGQTANKEQPTINLWSVISDSPNVDVDFITYNKDRLNIVWDIDNKKITLKQFLSLFSGMDLNSVMVNLKSGHIEGEKK